MIVFKCHQRHRISRKIYFTPLKTSIKMPTIVRVPPSRILEDLQSDFDSNLQSNLPVLKVSGLAGVFPFNQNGHRTKILTFWSYVITMTAGPSSLLLAIYQIDLAYQSTSRSKNKELMYTCLELFKSVLFSSSLLVHVYCTWKHELIFKYVVTKIAKLGIPSVGRWDLIFGSGLFCVRFLSLVHALSLVENKVDIYVLRSNALINLLCWLNYLVIFQMISLVNSVKIHLGLWRSESLYTIHIHHHAWIVQVMQKVVFLYGRQLVLITCQCVYAATTSGYYLATNVFFNDEDVFITFHVIDVISLVLSMYQLVSLARSCENVKFKVDAFYKELFRLMRESKTLCSNKKLCLYVSMRKTVNFTACGFFSLGYPLITSIIAAATTYLVILVQFSIQKS